MNVWGRCGKKRGGGTKGKVSLRADFDLGAGERFVDGGDELRDVESCHIVAVLVLSA